MDDIKLEKIISADYAPHSDENARKRAVNLALAEFNTAQSEINKKSSQGVSILSRLMGMSNTSKGRETMEEKLHKKSYRKLYQGAALMVIGTGLFTVPMLMEGMHSTIGSSSVSAPAPIKMVQFSMDGGVMTFSSDVPSSNFSSPASVDAVEQENEKALELALMKGGDSLMPVPVDPPEDRLEIAGNEASEDPLHRWRKVQAEREGQVINGAIAASPQIIIGDDADTQSQYNQDENRDRFEFAEPEPFKQVAAEPVSTFSSDVDTASYAFVRRQLNNGILPTPYSVRVEEMVNYFDYNYPLPESREQPFKPTVTVMDSPWANGKKLMHIGIKGYDIQGEKPHANLVFLLDVSGSMNEPNKLPLVKASMKMLLDNLKPDDTIAITVYAGAAGTVLEPTKVSERSRILQAIDNLSAGGSTAGEAGINLAYQLAEQNFNKEGVNRIILATDGDFNVGTSNTEELKRLVEKKRKSGVFLSVLGFGQGNYNDQIMQTLAQNGNGVAAYIDTLNEARKVLVDEASSSLFPIAKDVKFQVEFNPKTVAEYRLVGYETRTLNREDFNNDRVDAGDMGAGHTVTAIYEFVPVGSSAVSVDPLRYGETEVVKPATESVSDNGEYAFLKIRYKLPNEDVSKLITTPVTNAKTEISQDVRFSIAVAAFGQILDEDIRFSTSVSGFGQTPDEDGNIKTMTLDDIIALAQQSKGEDPFGYRAEFINLVRLAKAASPE